MNNSRKNHELFMIISQGYIASRPIISVSLWIADEPIASVSLLIRDGPGSIFIAINSRFLIFRVEGAVDILSLEKSLKDLLSVLRQTQTPQAFESVT